MENPPPPPASGGKIARSTSAAGSSHSSTTTSPSPTKGSKLKPRRVTLTIQQVYNKSDDPESILATLNMKSIARPALVASPIAQSSPRMASSSLQLSEGLAVGPATATYFYKCTLSPPAIKEEESVAALLPDEPPSHHHKKGSDLSDEALMKSVEGSGALHSKARALEKLHRFDELRKISRARRGLPQRTSSDGSDSSMPPMMTRGVTDRAFTHHHGDDESSSRVSRSKSSLV